MYTVFRLNPGTPYDSVSINHDAAAIIIDNPTASPVYIRVGAPDIPTDVNADIIVPAAQSKSVPVTALGRDFGLAIGNPSLLNTTTSGISGLFSTVTIQILSPGEPVPAFGSSSFLSLSLSDLVSGFPAISGPATSSWFDLGPWGGAVIYLAPSSASGQGVMTVQVTDSIAGTPVVRSVGTWAFWPSSPIVANIPRISRYMRVVFNDVAISGNPSIAGEYNVRASLTEILQPSYTPGGTASISKSYTVAALGTQNLDFVTVGLPSLSVGISSATGGNNQVLYFVAPTLAGPWRRATQREQNMTPGGLGATQVRTFGALDNFFRVSMVETSNVSMSGTINMLVTQELDTGVILSEILNALGTTYDPVNVGQNIYQVLKTVVIDDTTRFTQLGSIDSRLSTTNVNLATMASQLTTIQTLIGTTNSNLNTVNTNLNTINTSINTMLTPLSVAQTKSGYMVAGEFLYTSATAAYVSVGFLLVQASYIESCMLSIRGDNFFNEYAAGSPIALRAAYGTLASPSATPFYTVAPSVQLFTTGSGSAWIQGQGPVMQYGSIRSPGIVIPASNQVLWISGPLTNASPLGPIIHYSIALTT